MCVRLSTAKDEAAAVLRLLTTVPFHTGSLSSQLQMQIRHLKRLCQGAEHPKTLPKQSSTHTEHIRQHSVTNRECFNFASRKKRQQKTWDTLFFCCCFEVAITILQRKKMLLLTLRQFLLQTAKQKVIL